MKLGLFTLMLSVSGIVLCSRQQRTSGFNAFTSGSAKVEKFNNARRSNDWSISFRRWYCILHHSDLTSLIKMGNILDGMLMLN